MQQLQAVMTDHCDDESFGAQIEINTNSECEGNRMQLRVLIAQWHLLLKMVNVTNETKHAESRWVEESAHSFNFGWRSELVSSIHFRLLSFHSGGVDWIAIRFAKRTYGAP